MRLRRPLIDCRRRGKAKQARWSSKPGGALAKAGAMTAHPCGSGFPPDALIDRLARLPGVQKVPSPKLTLFIKRDFVPAALCAALMARIDAERRPSTVSDYNGDPGYRTSETCDLRAGEPLTEAIEQALADFLGLDPAYGEPLQGQRYAVGQEFKQHTDYFEPSSPDYEKFCAVAGQRTWTAMLYLNEPDAGGATRFKAIDKIVQPETGKLLLWNNLRADGQGNAATLHHGMKVRSGTKYVLTKWYRMRPWG